MKVKIFWKKNCPRCPEAKEMGEILKKEIEVQYCDVDTIEGLSQACMFNVMATPSVILLDQEENQIEAWRGTVPEIGGIRKKITSVQKQ